MEIYNLISSGKQKTPSTTTSTTTSTARGVALELSRGPSAAKNSSFSVRIREFCQDSTEQGFWTFSLRLISSSSDHLLELPDRLKNRFLCLRIYPQRFRKRGLDCFYPWIQSCAHRFPNCQQNIPLSISIWNDVLSMAGSFFWRSEVQCSFVHHGYLCQQSRTHCPFETSLCCNAAWTQGLRIVRSDSRSFHRRRLN